MVHLCDRLKKWLVVASDEPYEICSINKCNVKLYKGESVYRTFALPAYAIPEESFLNFIIEDEDGNLFGINHQEMQGNNISLITGVWGKDGELWAYHWDGFTSRFDPNNGFKLIEQRFTK